MKKLLADTLFKRLFLLMWAALVVSHLAGFVTARAVLDARPVHDAARPPGPPDISPMDALPEPPPLGGPRSPNEADGGGMPRGIDARDLPGGPLPGAPWSLLGLDYLVRFIVIGIAAWVGARWLSGPMHRLADASRALTRSLSQHRRPAPLHEGGGTLEVQQTAEVFNTMATQLHEQFEARGLMLAAISHDLRTPLTRLRLRLEQMDPGLLKDRCVADVQQADLLIASVLDSLRLSHQAVAPQRIDLRALLQSLVDDLVEQGQPVSCEVLPLERPARVLADTAELQRVIGNLVGNAVRHGGAARVSLGEQGEHLLVRVDDDGPGIPEAELESVFQPFYRVDTSRSRDTGGIGLGLYIARDLAQRHGGTLALANRAEGGLRAELTLPRAS